MSDTHSYRYFYEVFIWNGNQENFNVKYIWDVYLYIFSVLFKVYFQVGDTGIWQNVYFLESVFYVFPIIAFLKYLYKFLNFVISVQFRLGFRVVRKNKNQFGI